MNDKKLNTALEKMFQWWAIREKTIDKEIVFEQLLKVKLK